MTKQVIMMLGCFVFGPMAYAQSVSIITQSPQQGSMIIGHIKGNGDIYYQNEQLTKTSKGILYLE